VAADDSATMDTAIPTQVWRFMLVSYLLRSKLAGDM